MMEAIGQSAYLLKGPNSENVLTGGFVAGHGGNTTIIKTQSSWNPKTDRHEGTWHNWFSGILCEPGPGSECNAQPTRQRMCHAYYAHCPP